MLAGNKPFMFAYGDDPFADRLAFNCLHELRRNKSAVAVLELLLVSFVIRRQAVLTIKIG